MLQVGGVRFDPDTRSIVVPLPAGLDAQAEKLARAFWSHGWGPDDVGKLGLTPGDPDPVLPVGPTLNEFDLKIGAVEHHQVFIKIALELLAYHRHDLAMRGELSEARRFARRGDGSFRGKPDSRSSGSGLLPTTEELPMVHNSIEVWSCGNSVFFRVVFLGPLVFTGTLTTEWSGESFRAIYAFDARDPANEIARRFESGDGPNLVVWFGEVKEESSANAVAAIEKLSLELARSKPRVEREAPPEIEALREAVRAKLAAMPPPKKRRKVAP